MDVGVHPAKRAALAAAGMRPPVHRTLPLPFTELPYTIHAWSSYRYGPGRHQGSTAAAG